MSSAFSSFFTSHHFLIFCSAAGGATIFFFLQKVTEKLNKIRQLKRMKDNNNLINTQRNEEQDFLKYKEIEEKKNEEFQEELDAEEEEEESYYSEENVSRSNEERSVEEERHEENTETDVPENAPESCPGVESQHAGKTASCEGCPNKQICLSGEARKHDSSIPSDISKNLSEIKHKILVLSGKGGVGKSTVSAQLAWGLSECGFHVGLLDVDICGPSIPRMTNTLGCDVHQSREGWQPIYLHNDRLAVMSIGFLLPSEDDAVIWRGPKKNGLIKQFLTDVTWGKLDFLIIDTPPGTSDEHLSIVTYLKNSNIDGAIIVTTPQEISLQDVRKEINFCKKVEIEVLGVVENMNNSIFTPSTGGAKAMCEKMGVPYALSIPLDSSLMRACEEGCSVMEIYGQSEAAEKISQLILYVLNVLKIDMKNVNCNNEENNESDHDTDEGCIDVNCGNSNIVNTEIEKDNREEKLNDDEEGKIESVMISQEEEKVFEKMRDEEKKKEENICLNSSKNTITNIQFNNHIYECNADNNQINESKISNKKKKKRKKKSNNNSNNDVKEKQNKNDVLGNDNLINKNMHADIKNDLEINSTILSKQNVNRNYNDDTSMLNGNAIGAKVDT